MKLMEHPQHGRMHVYNKFDFDTAVANGWTEVTDSIDNQQQIKQQANSIVGEIQQQPVKRRGRPRKNASQSLRNDSS